MPILGDFAVKYSTQAEQLGVPTDDLYQALVDTAENTASVLSRIPDPPLTMPRSSFSLLTGTWVRQRNFTERQRTRLTFSCSW